ncbi:hypothetical protein [Streptomyces sp. NPDC006784]|uniref:hypothetical protein n=1 Tax=Streptomyces sp. NPDC006784 TaxID=3364764 RepID=UPI003692300A
MNFSTATTLNAKANAAVADLHERGLLPVPSGMSAETVRAILDVSDREHGLLPTRSPSWPAGDPRAPVVLFSRI